MESLALHDPNVYRMGTPLVKVVSMTPLREKNSGPNHGIIYDYHLARALRPASFEELLLLAFEEDNRELEAIPRYFLYYVRKLLVSLSHFGKSYLSESMYMSYLHQSRAA